LGLFLSQRETISAEPELGSPSCCFNRGKAFISAFPVLEIIARFEQAEMGIEAPQRDIAQPLIKRPAKKKGDQEEL
jgi:hypothetical protein